MKLPEQQKQQVKSSKKTPNHMDCAKVYKKMRCFFSCIKILYHEKVVTPFSTFRSTHTTEKREWRWKRNRNLDTITAMEHHR